MKNEMRPVQNSISLNFEASVSCFAVKHTRALTEKAQFNENVASRYLKMTLKNGI